MKTDIFKAFFVVEFVEGRTGRVHRPFNGGLELIRCDQYGFDVESGTERNFIDDFVIGRIHHSDEELVAPQVQGQGLVFFDQRFADQADGRLAQVESR